MKNVPISSCFLVILFAAACLSDVSVALGEKAVVPKFERQEIDKIQIGYGVAIGDVDGDKKPDILLADKKDFAWYKNPAGQEGSKGAGSWKKHIMVTNLTQRDNVCIDARDINGDGKVEVAVGAMWNPGETTSDKLSGSVHYLIRPKDPTAKWTPVKLHNEPTIHRMRWVQVANEKHQLVVLPLHGRGNKGGAGAGVNVLAYDVPEDPNDAKAVWKTSVVDNTMHMTHNMDVFEKKGPDGVFAYSMILVAGKQGGGGFMPSPKGWQKLPKPKAFSQGSGEIRVSQKRTDAGYGYVATIEPMHGNNVVVYAGKQGEPGPKRTVLDSTLKHGHALGIADVLGIGRPQVIAGWRFPNSDKKVGVKIYVPRDDSFEKFDTYLIDDNKMACEDLKLADLNGDGKLDIITAGRGTKNLVIYWNRTGE